MKIGVLKLGFNSHPFLGCVIKGLLRFNVLGFFILLFLPTVSEAALEVYHSTQYYGTITSSRGGPFTPVPYQLENTGGSSLDWLVSSSQTWVDIEDESGNTSGTLAAGDVLEMVALFNTEAESLGLGTHTSTLTFSDTTNGTDEEITLNLELIEIGSLKVYRNLSTATEREGGPYSPDSIFLENTTSVSVDWEVTIFDNWIDVEGSGGNSSGTLPSGAVKELTLSVNSNADAFGSGSVNEATFFITDNSHTAITELTKTLTIGDGFLQTSGSLDTVTGSAGGPFRFPKTLYIENTGNGSLDWEISSTDTWFGAEGSDGNSSGTLGIGEAKVITAFFNEDANGFSAGTYTGTLTITDSTNNVDIFKTVTLTINPGVLEVESSDTTITSVGNEGGPFSVREQSYTLKNAGEDSFDWQVDVDQTWVTVETPASAVSGTLAPGELQEIVISLNSVADSLSPGTHTATIDIEDTTNSNTISRTFSLTVDSGAFSGIGNGVLQVDQFGNFNTTLTATGNYGGPFSPISRMYTLTNIGGQSLDWTATIPESWVFLDQTSGTLEPGEQTVVKATFNNNANILQAGFHNSEIEFKDATNNLSAGVYTQSINISSGLLNFNNNNLYSTASQGKPFIDGTLFRKLTNTGGSPLDWTGSSSVNWITVTPNSGTLQPGESLYVKETLNSNAESLAPSINSYTGDLTYTNTTNDYGSWTIINAVRLVVREGTLLVDNLHLKSWVEGNQGGPFKPFNSTLLTLFRKLTNTGGYPLDWAISSSVNWITVTPGNGTLQSGETIYVKETVNSNAESLGPSTGYKGNLRYTNTTNDKYPTETNNAFNLNVNPGKLSVVNPNPNAYATGPPGGPFKPWGGLMTNYRELTNTGGSIIDWAASSPVDWVMVTPKSGTLQPGETIFVKEALNKNNADGLGPHYWHTGNLKYFNTTNDSGSRLIGNGSNFWAYNLFVTGTEASGELTSISTNVIDVSGPGGGPFDINEQLFITNTSGFDIDWSADTDQDWLTVTPNSGTLADNDSQFIEISVNENADNLAYPGIYTALIGFNNLTNGEGDQIVTFTLTVGGDGELFVSPTTAIESSGGDGGPFIPTTRSFTMENAGEEPIQWNLFTDKAWLDFKEDGTGNQTGTLGVGESTTVNATLNEDAEDVSPGFHDAYLGFQNLTNGMGEEAVIFSLDVAPVKPVIRPIADQFTEPNKLFTSPPPVTSGSKPITYSLAKGPEGMTIDPDTGVVTWDNPDPDGAVELVTIRATNAGGSDEESWNLNVTSDLIAPVILISLAPAAEGGSSLLIPNAVIEESPLTNIKILPDVPYTGPTFDVTGTGPFTWELLEGPFGMDIDPVTGVVSWETPVLTGASPGHAGGPVDVKIRACNGDGCDDVFWTIEVTSVIDTLNLTRIDDEDIEADKDYTAISSVLEAAQPVKCSMSDDAPDRMIAEYKSSLGFQGGCFVTWRSPEDGDENNPNVLNASDSRSNTGQQQWQLDVKGGTAPTIETVPDQKILTDKPYTQFLKQASGTIPVTWSLVEAPSGVLINNVRGAVTWAKPEFNGESKTITVKVENGSGNDTESWVLTEDFKVVTITSGPSGTPDPIVSGGDVVLTIESTHSQNLPINYSWTAFCQDMSSHGTFNDSTIKEPTWTAPINNTGDFSNCTIFVDLIDDGGFTDSGDYSQSVEPEGYVEHALTISSDPAGTPNPVSSGGTVSLSVTGYDTDGHAIDYSWSASCPDLDSNGFFNNSLAQNPIWSAPINDSGSSRNCTLSVELDDNNNGLPASGNFIQTVNNFDDPVGVTDHKFFISSGPDSSPNPVSSGEKVLLSVSATDEENHTINYFWSAFCSGLSSSGTFDNPQAQNPTWTAPINNTDGSKECTLFANLDDGHGLTASDSLIQTVNHVVDSGGGMVHSLTISSGPDSSPNPVPSGGSVSLSVAGSDTENHMIQYSWTASCPVLGSNGSFDNASAQNPTWAAPVNDTDSSSNCTISVELNDGHGLTTSVDLTQTVELENVTNHNLSITQGPDSSSNLVSAGGEISLSVTGLDTEDHPIDYFWSAFCPDLGSNGIFDKPFSQNPTWIAPTKNVGVSKECSIFVNLSDGHGLIETGTLTQIVTPPSGDLSVMPLDEKVAGGMVGGPFVPSHFNYALSASNGGVEYAVSNTTDYLDLSNTRGSIHNRSQARVHVTVNSNAEFLLPGKHQDTLTFTNTTLGTSEDRVMRLFVGDPNANQRIRLPEQNGFHPVCIKTLCTYVAHSYTLTNLEDTDINFMGITSAAWLDLYSNTVDLSFNADGSISMRDLPPRKADNVFTGTIPVGQSVTVNANINSGVAEGSSGDAAIIFYDSDSNELLAMDTVPLMLLDDPFETPKSLRVISPYWQADNSVYTFIAVSHPGLSMINSQVGVEIDAIQSDMVPFGPTAEFTISANNTKRVFIVATNNENINETTIPDGAFIVGTSTGKHGQLVITPEATDPNSILANGYPDVTMLNFWGAVVVQDTSTGFAMEFVGDTHDSQAVGNGNVSGVN